MPINSADEFEQELEPSARVFYRKVLTILNSSGIPYLVGGAYALERYAGIERDTKDFDVFTRPDDCRRILDLFSSLGYRTELTFPHWLGKIFNEGHTVDVIFASGNGISRVDDDWFQFAVDDTVLETPIRLTPAEEMIHSKAYIKERERYDGADIAHIIRAVGDKLDWHRLLAKMGPHWKVLFAHIAMFDFIYPSDRDKIPLWLIQECVRRFATERDFPGPTDRVCYGTLISREQYLKDIQEWGYKDARLVSPQTMREEDVRTWTEAIKTGK